LLVDEDELRFLDGSNGLRQQVVALDRRVFDELRMAYADKPWTDANFDYPLPGKADLSFVVSRGSRVLGFWIASERVAGEAHTHRVAVEPSWRNGVLSRRLFCAFWRAAITRPGVSHMTVELGAENARARLFYETLGFYAASPRETKGYLEARGRNELIDGVEILGAGGGRSIVMLRRVETEL
jgi:ribosomal protein S18 acetylase RimI-like enzyme